MNVRLRLSKPDRGNRLGCAAPGANHFGKIVAVGILALAAVAHAQDEDAWKPAGSAFPRLGLTPLQTTEVVRNAAAPEAAPAQPQTPPASFAPTPIPAQKPVVESAAAKGSYIAAQPVVAATALPIAGCAVLLFSVVAAGVWLLRSDTRALRTGRKMEGKLQITDLQALGNRQYLAVAEIEGQKLLLGVSPGRIDTLCELRDTSVVTTAPGDVRTAQIGLFKARESVPTYCGKAV